MTLASAFGYSLLIGVPCYLAWFAFRTAVPRKASYDPQAEPYGDVPYQEERL